jgi:glyoxylase I family protein
LHCLSQTFYERLGFEQIHRWDAKDKSLTILHLKLDTVVLELFAYVQNANTKALDLEVANNLPEVGVKHVGLRAADVRASFAQMQAAGYELGSPEVQQGRTDIDYFFIKDPDGIWVEIAQDDRGY